MATTIDKYVLETSVTGMKDVDALNTSVTTLGKSIDTVTSKKIAMTINATGFDDLNTKIGNINTSLNTLATKTAKPTVSLAGIDQLNSMISGLSSSINQLSSNAININANTGQVTAAKQEVDRLGNAIDGVDRKNINVKAEVGGGILSQNIDNLKNSMADMSSNVLVAALAALGAFGVKTVQTAGELTKLANASTFTTSELVSLGDSIKAADGKAEDAAEFVTKLMEAINDAADGADGAIQSFTNLNVPIKDINGNMRATPAIAADVIKALGKMTDPTKRQKQATELLGESLANLDYSKITFANDTILTDQIKKTNQVNTAWDRLSGSIARSGFTGVAAVANKISDGMDALTSIIKNSAAGFDILSSSGDGVVSFFNRLFDAVSPLSMILVKTNDAVMGLLELTHGGKIQGGAPILNSAGVEPTDIKAIRYANEAENMKGYVPRDSYKPEPIDPSRFGTSKAAADKAASEAKAAAERAKAERDARDRARQSMDAEMTALKAASNMKLEAIKHEGTLLGLSSKAASENRAAIEIQNNLKRDYQKIDAEILQEKQKGSKADQYIIDKLKEQKGIVNDLASSSLDQLTANNSIKQGIEDRTTALKSQYDAVLGISKLEDSDVKTAAIQKEIDKHTLLKDQYTAQYDELVKIGEQQGLLSAAYLTAAENFTAYNDVWMQTMDAQKSKIAELQAAEKTRSESFAGGWESAMQRMTKSMTESYSGSQAFNDLWGSITSNIDQAVTSGKFKFADFRDAIINDLAAIARKALASKLTSWLINTFVGSSKPISGGGGAAIGGDKGGSAIFPRAGGGSVSGNQPYLVGERGPELFMPGQNGTIIPNRNLEADSKPQVITNNYYNVSAVDGQSVARFFMENKNLVAAANNSVKRERS